MNYWKRASDILTFSSLYWHHLSYLLIAQHINNKSIF